MTGYGGASVQDDGTTVLVEMKAVNNRYLKISLRISDGFASFESRIENVIRESLKRGTVNVSLRIFCERSTADYSINEAVLKQYAEQLQLMNHTMGIAREVSLDQLLSLPGVFGETAAHWGGQTDKVWPLIEQGICEALQKLNEMRKAEGDSMVADLVENCGLLAERIEQVILLAPNVSRQYRERLTERMERIMNEQNLKMDSGDLVREVALFADKSDISEEIVRFKSHLMQFEVAMTQNSVKDGCGRKLDFLTQELFREINTIGSKANDAEITKNVVEMKTIVERIREMVQNVE